MPQEVEGVGTNPECILDTELGGARHEQDGDARPESQSPSPDPEPQLQQAAEVVWQRRQHFPRQARREGCQVMRLLTQAAQSPSPHSEEEAFKLFRQLLEIFIRSRAVRQAQNLNGKVKRALVEMLEGRYGPQVFVDGEPLASLLRATEADYKRLLAQEKAEREARRAGREQAASASGLVTGSGEQGTEGTGNQQEASASHQAEAEQGARDGEQVTGYREQGTEDQQADANAAGQHGEADSAEPADQLPRPLDRPPELPQTFGEFLDLFARAFAPPRQVREVEYDRILVHQLAEAVWMRLHVYEERVRQESQRLGAVLERAAQPVACFKDLRRRTYALEHAFEIEPWLTNALEKLTADLEEDIRQLLKWRYGPAVHREVSPPPPRRYPPDWAGWAEG